MTGESRSDVFVRQLGPADADALAALRREALSTHPFAFASSLEDDRAVSVDAVRGMLADDAAAVVLGAFVSDSLVGMLGVRRLEKVKLRHRADVWGVYVTPGARGRGIADGLMRAAIARCSAWPGVRQVHLCVSLLAPEAERVYLRHGFRSWGREPRSLAWEGRFADEHHMVFDLDGAVADLDHIVVVAPTLDEGSSFVEHLLGETPFEGGQHRELGTHNRLLRLGEALFLEVIAPDTASRHLGPRVFGIGNVASVRADWERGVRLRAYVARTASLEAVAREHGSTLGVSKHVTRGTRSWNMLIPDDGSLPLAGLAPTVVEYEPGMVPAIHMPASECSLVELVVACPNADEVRALHSALGLSGAVTVREAPVARLAALIQTPSGIVLLQ